MENKFVQPIKSIKDPLIREGVEDYCENSNSTNHVEQGQIFESSYSGVHSLFTLLSAEKIKHDFENDYDCYEYLTTEFKRIMIEKIKNEEFVEIIDFCKNLLSDFADIKNLEKLNIENAGDNILITEAVNWSAKISTDAFYMLKPAMIVASAKNGAKIGVINDDGWDTYYLFDQKSGVASLHDPNGEVQKLLQVLDESIEIKEWEFGWSGISRQNMAYYLISEKEQLFMKRMRYATVPGDNAREKRELFQEIENKYSI